MKKLLCLLIFSLFTVNLIAQYVDNGQDASSIKWKQIETNNFKLIYPSDSEALAQKFANLFNSLHKKEYSSLNHKPRKIPIILHSHGGISNGAVLWAPRRMELFASSQQHNDFVSFIEHLGVHEYRHVVQIDKMNQGLTKFGSYIFGEHAAIGVMGVYVPMWFLEGDAVAFETGNTKGGRGRLPSFGQELRAQLVEKGVYSYDKSVFGTFNDHTPDRYKLGYYMIANARKHYGTKIWEKTIDEMARRPWNIYCFEAGMKKVFMPKRDSVWREMAKEYSKYDSKFVNVDSLLEANKYSDPKLTLYADNMTELLAKWSKEDEAFKSKKYAFLNKKNKLYASYKYPQRTERSTVIAFKDDLNDIDAIVEIDGDKKERVLTYPSSSIKDLDYDAGTLVWSEYMPHLRWENGGRTVLVVYDVLADSLNRYRYKDNLFNPCISVGGKIALVSENHVNETSLLLFSKGEFSNLLEAEGEEVFQMPTWIGSNKLAFIVLDDKGKRIEILNLDTQKRRIIAKAEEADIANLKYSDGKIYYSSSYSGKDEICSVDVNTGVKKRVTSARFGNRYADVSNYKMLYSSYTADGYQILEDSIKEREYGDKAIYELAEMLKEQEKPELLERDSTPVVFKTKKYSKLGHLFKIHSWAPLFVNGFDRTVEGFADLGVSFASQNDLSTMFLVAGMRRDREYNSCKSFVQMKYKAFWPEFDIEASYRNIDASFKDAKMQGVYPDSDNYIRDEIYNYGTLSRIDLSGSISLPFNISKGAYLRGFTPFLKHEWYHFSPLDIDRSLLVRWKTTDKYEAYKLEKYEGSENNSFDINVLSYNFLFYNLRRKALRDMNPKWGQVLEVGYINSPFGDREFGRSFYGTLKLYMPGLMNNHSLSLYSAYQQYSNSSFIRNIKIPKGIHLNDNYENLSVIKSSYLMPLMYPDYSLGGILYAKRIYTNLFCETVLTTGKENMNFYSAGVDLRANIHIMRFKTPIDIGVRGGYESQTQSPFFEFLFNVSFDI